MTEAYRVLARKYRPTRFSDMVGQDVLVRTLTNAIESGRLAHAWLLTGIRGVGKTTTARIIARALNCIGPDGNGGPTPEPCGVCSNCKMIAEDRHVDVIEMDAASRTGVADIRDIIETVHYSPAAARFKIYIIDEVHMLSTNAFNALLKTLEEPPPHVKFIFATTETRKIPVTILSRCQRFDLARVKVEMLASHLARICAEENVSANEEALRLISTAAEGSVRDSLSMLDQAIAQSNGENVSANLVRDMLGLNDKSNTIALLEHVFEGKTQQAIESLHGLYQAGADPLMLLQDMLELVHFLTRLKTVPKLHKDLSLAEAERTRSKALADALDIPALTRAWQMLIKGAQEARQAANPLAATEMVLIRLMYASTLPSPADLVRTLQKTPETTAAPLHSAPASSPTPLPVMQSGSHALSAAPRSLVDALPRTPLALVEAEPAARVGNFEELVELFAARKEMVLYSYLRQEGRVVSFEPGKLELHHISSTPPDFTTRMARYLTAWTGEKWHVNFSQQQGAETIRERENIAQEQEMKEAANDPMVTECLKAFPGAKLVEIIKS